MSGKIYIVGTPIGNMGDISKRAAAALKCADVVCCEDTRVTGKLLSALGVEASLERMDEATMAARIESVCGRAAAGVTFAYCSDAGMPGVSDPGLRLIDAAYEAGVAVEVVPGPTAAATAYVASGTSALNFYFGGFFPRKNAEREKLLQSLSLLDAALIFYESPKRICSALKLINDVLPLRKVAVCRELTKLHEEVCRGRVAEVLQTFEAREASAGGIKGEIVFVIDPASEDELAANTRVAAQNANARAAELASEGLKTKEISKRLTAEFQIPRNEAYEIAMQVSK